LVEWKRIFAVNRAEVPWETILMGSTVKGPFVLTAGHRIFITPTEKITMEEACRSGTGGGLLCVALGEESDPLPGDWGGDPRVGYRLMRQCGEVEHRQYMFDLTTEDWHNFVLVRSGLVVSNSPDRNYHFRPPEFEADIGRFNRVFGQIWQDDELLEYCERALDWYNQFPPFTGNSITSLDLLVSQMPTWRTAILWGAIAHACFAVALNWVADEFDYSIGGVSLTIEKSSKYESLKQNAESMFDKATEAKARTVKFIRGLQQPRFGIGVRSAFGPFTGRGVLSPRNFLVLPIFLTLGAFLGTLSGGLSGVC
jgi:hypothetical protein